MAPQAALMARPQGVDSPERTTVPDANALAAV
jgi:hypothetical protein